MSLAFFYSTVLQMNGRWLAADAMAYIARPHVSYDPEEMSRGPLPGRAGASTWAIMSKMQWHKFGAKYVLK